MAVPWRCLVKCSGYRELRSKCCLPVFLAPGSSGSSPSLAMNSWVLGVTEAASLGLPETQGCENHRHNCFNSCNKRWTRGSQFRLWDIRVRRVSTLCTFFCCDYGWCPGHNRVSLSQPTSQASSQAAVHCLLLLFTCSSLQHPLASGSVCLACTTGAQPPFGGCPLKWGVTQGLLMTSQFITPAFTSFIYQVVCAVGSHAALHPGPEVAHITNK